MITAGGSGVFPAYGAFVTVVGHWGTERVRLWGMV